jgi:hypothetical protein
VLTTLLLFVGNAIRRDTAHQQFSMALRRVENFLSLAMATARLEHVYVRILWDVADPSSGREQQFFLLSSAEIGPSAEWKLCRSEHLPEHCRLLLQIDSQEFQAGDIIGVSEEWIMGTSVTLDSGAISLREWSFRPSGELIDAEGKVPAYRSIGVGYGKNQSPLGCILVNANGHIQTYEGIKTIQTILSEFNLVSG